jgi:hypothetical protein
LIKGKNCDESLWERELRSSARLPHPHVGKRGFYETFAAKSPKNSRGKIIFDNDFYDSPGLVQL